MIRFGHILLVSALMISIGAPLALLQSVAWVRMSVSYSVQSGSVAQGLREAFDGQHPCKLCRAIAKGKHTGQKESKDDAGKKKVELGFERAFRVVFTSPPFENLPRAGDLTGRDRSESPPDQPPRQA
jgi:hypothetical protein